jgi:TP901 family phage tail tape measure protein
VSSTTLARLNVLLGAEHSELDRALKDIEQRVEKTGKKLSGMGRGLTKNVTAPLLAIGAAGFKVAGDFEASLAKMEGLVGIQRDQIDAWRGDIRSLATDYGSSATEAADALFFITSAGLRGADAMDTLEASLKASAAGLGDVTTIADLSTSAMNAYGSDVLSAAGATDVLTAAVREGKLEPRELAGAMGSVLPIASEMGIRFDELGAAMAAMSRTGTNAAQASTQLRSIMTSLLRPTADAEAQLKEMGLSASGLRRQIREDGLLSVLQTLDAEFKANEDAAARVFGNVRALSGVLDMMGGSADTTAEIFGELADTSGALDAAFDAQDTSMFKLSQMWAALKDLALEVGDAILPSVTAVIEKVTGALKALTAGIGALPGPVKAAVVALAGIAVAAGPVLLVVGKLMTMAPLVTKALAGIATVAAAMKAPLVALAAAKVSATAAATGLWVAMAPALPVLAAIGAAVGVSVLVWRKWGDQIMLAVRAAVNVIRDRLEPVVTFVRAFASRVAEAFRWFRDNALKPVRDFVLRVGEWLIDRLGLIIQRVAQIVGRVARALNPALGAALDAVADFVDDTRKEMIRLRGSVEDETGAATQALGAFKQALSDFSQEELEITATGLGRNLIEAEKELDALRQAQKRASKGTVADMQAATDAVARQEANVRQLRASYEAVAAAVRGVGKEVEAATGGGGAGDGVAGAAKEIRDVMGELEASLAEADGMGAALGNGFDVAAAKASAYETAVRELVASGVSLDAVVGRQGQTLRELADTYLSLRAQQRLMSEGEAITGRLLTAEETRAAQLERLDNLLTAGAISEEVHARAVEQAEEAYMKATPAGERYLELLRAQDQVLRDIQSPLERYDERLALLDEMLNTVDETTGEALLTQEQYNAAVAAAETELERATNAAASFGDTMDDVGAAIESGMTRGLQSVVQFTTSSESRFAQWATQVINEITRVITRMLALRALSAFVPGGSLLGAAAGIATRHTGGPVRSGQAYAWRPREEMFVPSQGGHILTNRQAERAIADSGTGGGTLTLDASSLPPRPAMMTPDAVATDDWWRRAFSHLKLDHDDRGGL